MTKRAVEDGGVRPEQGSQRDDRAARSRGSVNAERIELFANARESELRESDGTFFCAEATRQVMLGYGRDYGRARG